MIHEARGPSGIWPKGWDRTLFDNRHYRAYLEALRKALLSAGRRWQRLDRESIRGTFQELRKERKAIIRQEDLRPPNDPLRLSFQCQRAVVDLHLVELRGVAAERGIRVARVG